MQRTWPSINNRFPTSRIKRQHCFDCSHLWSHTNQWIRSKPWVLSSSLPISFSNWSSGSSCMSPQQSGPWKLLQAHDEIWWWTLCYISMVQVSAAIYTQKHTDLTADIMLSMQCCNGKQGMLQHSMSVGIRRIKNYERRTFKNSWRMMLKTWLNEWEDMDKLYGVRHRIGQQRARI